MCCSRLPPERFPLNKPPAGKEAKLALAICIPNLLRPARPCQGLLFLPLSCLRFPSSQSPAHLLPAPSSRHPMGIFHPYNHRDLAPITQVRLRGRPGRWGGGGIHHHDQGCDVPKVPSSTCHGSPHSSAGAPPCSRQLFPSFLFPPFSSPPISPLPPLPGTGGSTALPVSSATLLTSTPTGRCSARPTVAPRSSRTTFSR